MSCGTKKSDKKRNGKTHKRKKANDDDIVSEASTTGEESTIDTDDADAQEKKKVIQNLQSITKKTKRSSQPTTPQRFLRFLIYGYESALKTSYWGENRDAAKQRMALLVELDEYLEALIFDHFLTSIVISTKDATTTTTTTTATTITCQIFPATTPTKSQTTQTPTALRPQPRELAVRTWYRRKVKATDENQLIQIREMADELLFPIPLKQGLSELCEYGDHLFQILMKFASFNIVHRYLVECVQRSTMELHYLMSDDRFYETNVAVRAFCTDPYSSTKIRLSENERIQLLDIYLGLTTTTITTSIQPQPNSATTASAGSSETSAVTAGSDKTTISPSPSQSLYVMWMAKSLSNESVHHCIALRLMQRGMVDGWTITPNTIPIRGSTDYDRHRPSQVPALIRFIRSLAMASQLRDFPSLSSLELCRALLRTPPCPSVPRTCLLLHTERAGDLKSFSYLIECLNDHLSKQLQFTFGKDQRTYDESHRYDRYDLYTQKKWDEDGLQLRRTTKTPMEDFRDVWTVVLMWALIEWMTLPAHDFIDSLEPLLADAFCHTFTPVSSVDQPTAASTTVTTTASTTSVQTVDGPPMLFFQLLARTINDMEREGRYDAIFRSRATSVINRLGESLSHPIPWIRCCLQHPISTESRRSELSAYGHHDSELEATVFQWLMKQFPDFALNLITQWMTQSHLHVSNTTYPVSIWEEMFPATSVTNSLTNSHPTHPTHATTNKSSNTNVDVSMKGFSLFLSVLFTSLAYHEEPVLRWSDLYQLELWIRTLKQPLPPKWIDKLASFIDTIHQYWSNMLSKCVPSSRNRYSWIIMPLAFLGNWCSRKGLQPVESISDRIVEYALRTSTNKPNDKDQVHVLLDNDKEEGFYNDITKESAAPTVPPFLPHNTMTTTTATTTAKAYRKTKRKATKIGTPTEAARLTLVLDLDNTLVHRMISSKQADIMYEMYDDTSKPKLDPISPKATPREIAFQLDDPRRSPLPRQQWVGIAIRPNLATFMEQIRTRFELVVWTASEKEHANRCIDEIGGKAWFPSTHRLFLYHGCGNKQMKDLGRDLRHVVWVDDLLGDAGKRDTVLSPSADPNLVPAVPFYASATSDTTSASTSASPDNFLLGDLLPFLIQVHDKFQQCCNTTTATNEQSPMSFDVRPLIHEWIRKRFTTDSQTTTSIPASTV